MAKNSIKNFKFPTFEEWIKHSCEWTGRIGEYNCEIALVMWSTSGKENIYKIAISTHDTPTNIYAYTIHLESFGCRTSAKKKLQKWYESATTKANDKWKKYIERNYLE